jgi:hypothetical protein
MAQHEKEVAAREAKKERERLNFERLKANQEREAAALAVELRKKESSENERAKRAAKALVAKVRGVV